MTLTSALLHQLLLGKQGNRRDKLSVSLMVNAWHTYLV